ncbi:MAG TPA: hypothetical protein VE619_02645 [Nitrososphaeraceae archaeon]|nr:hypothetical protein [Nitrososphaeraceae archaeon]
MSQINHEQRVHYCCNNIKRGDIANSKGDHYLKPDSPYSIIYRLSCMPLMGFTDLGMLGVHIMLDYLSLKKEGAHTDE